MSKLRRSKLEREEARGLLVDRMLAQRRMITAMHAEGERIRAERGRTRPPGVAPPEIEEEATE